MAVNFGHIEFLMNYRVILHAKLAGDEEMHRQLVVPLTLKRKTEIVLATLDRIEDEMARGFVKEACDLIDRATGERNEILHGVWGFDTETTPQGAATVRSSKKKGKPPLDTAAISRIADEAAKATKLLVRAMYIANGITGEPQFPVPLWQGNAKPPGWT